MEFEFDQQKSYSNKEKHGIDFVEAQNLWTDELRLEIHVRTQDEKRLALIAEYAGKIWTAIFTIRNNHVRIISVRRSRKKEEELYIES